MCSNFLDVLAEKMNHGFLISAIFYICVSMSLFTYYIVQCRLLYVVSSLPVLYISYASFFRCDGKSSCVLCNTCYRTSTLIDKRRGIITYFWHGLKASFKTSSLSRFGHQIIYGNPYLFASNSWPQECHLWQPRLIMKWTYYPDNKGLQYLWAALKL